MPFALFPALWRVIQHVERAESSRVQVLHLVEFLFQQDILLRDVAKDEGDFGGVVCVFEDAARELVHWVYAGAAGNEGHVRVFVGRVGVLGDGALHVEGVAGFEGVDMFGHGAVGVVFDYYFEGAGVVCAVD